MRTHCVATLCAVLAAAACKKQEPPPPAAETPPVASSAAVEVPAAAPVLPAGPKADDMKLATIGPVPIPETNPQTDAKVALGNQLFFDKRMSVDGSRACYSCHLNEDGTGGHLPVAVGAKEKQLTRHSPVMWNVGYLPKLYWDGRSDSLEAQGLAAWAGGNMGVGKENLAAKAKEIGNLPEYKKQFAAAFPGKEVTAEIVMQAVAAYERTMVCDDTKYDKFAKGDKSALSDSEKRGLELFMGKAGCVTCHAPPYFSTAFLSKDGAFFNAGVGTAGKKEEDVDVGRMAVTKNAADWAAFKPPGLRNVSKTAPYFHDGSVADLREAVKLMAAGGIKNKNTSPLLTDRKLSDDELDSLVSFLKALECPGSLVEAKPGKPPKPAKPVKKG